MKKLSIIALAVATALTGVTPVYAAPIAVPSSPVTVQGDVQTVQYRREWIREREMRRDRREFRRDVREYRRDRRDWRGYHGYRDRRPGYRRHSDGWWYPLAAFGAGAVIGGAIASQPAPVYTAPAYSGGNAHIQWCANRYRTYRVSDNTYIPSAGVRAYCNSPYN